MYSLCYFVKMDYAENGQGLSINAFFYKSSMVRSSTSRVGAENLYGWARLSIFLPDFVHPSLPFFLHLLTVHLPIIQLTLEITHYVSDTESTLMKTTGTWPSSRRKTDLGSGVEDK